MTGTGTAEQGSSSSASSSTFPGGVASLGSTSSSSATTGARLGASLGDKLGASLGDELGTVLGAMLGASLGMLEVLDEGASETFVALVAAAVGDDVVVGNVSSSSTPIPAHPHGS